MSFVFIWENKMLPGGKTNQTGGRTWVGHASMNIGDALDDIFGEANGVLNKHVSWIPGGDNAEAKRVRVGGFAVNASGTDIDHLINDVAYEGYWPDHVIQLVDAGADRLKMQAEWNATRLQKSRVYNMLTNNCSTVVARVLKAGGVSAGSMWADNNLVWTPVKVRDFVLAAGGIMMGFKQFVGYLDAINLDDTDFETTDEDTKATKLIKYTRDGQFTSFRGPHGPMHNPDCTWKP